MSEGLQNTSLFITEFIRAAPNLGSNIHRSLGDPCTLQFPKFAIKIQKLLVLIYSLEGSPSVLVVFVRFGTGVAQLLSLEIGEALCAVYLVYLQRASVAYRLGGVLPVLRILIRFLFSEPHIILFRRPLAEDVKREILAEIQSKQEREKSEEKSGKAVMLDGRRIGTKEAAG